MSSREECVMSMMWLIRPALPHGHTWASLLAHTGLIRSSLLGPVRGMQGLAITYQHTSAIIINNRYQHQHFIRPFTRTQAKNKWFHWLTSIPVPVRSQGPTDNEHGNPGARECWRYYFVVVKRAVFNSTQRIKVHRVPWGSIKWGRLWRDPLGFYSW